MKSIINLVAAFAVAALFAMAAGSCSSHKKAEISDFSSNSVIEEQSVSATSFNSDSLFRLLNLTADSIIISFGRPDMITAVDASDPSGEPAAVAVGSATREARYRPPDPIPSQIKIYRPVISDSIAEVSTAVDSIYSEATRMEQSAASSHTEKQSDSSPSFLAPLIVLIALAGSITFIFTRLRK